MCSARTDRPGPAGNEKAPPESPAGGGTRVDGRIPAEHASPAGLTHAVLSLALLALLTGCASGVAEEARQGQARDAANAPGLPLQQATRTVERFFSPTPTPSPAPPPAPTLESLVITLGLAGGDAPQGSYASVPADARTVYAGALLNGVHAGQVVAARWVDAAGGTVGTSRVEIGDDGGQRWVALPLDLYGSLVPGEYAVYLFVGKQRLSSLVFQITPPGTGPQMLPELPANPSVDRGGPGSIPNQGGAAGSEDPRRRDNRGDEGLDPNSQDPMYGDPGLAQDQWAEEPAPVIVDAGVALPAETGDFVPVTQTP